MVFKVLLNKGFVALLLAGVVLIHVHKEWPFIRLPKLRNSIAEVSKPEFSKESWLEGTFQHGWEAFLKRHNAFFNSALMIFNQLEYSLFSRAHADGVIAGREGYLFEEKYIKAYFGTDRVADEKMNQFIEDLELVKKGLDSIGVKFVVAVAPSKVSFFPEYLPRRYDGFSIPEKTNRSIIKEALSHSDIPFLDLNEWYTGLKDESPYILYSKKGIHWTEYGMTLAMDTFIRFTENLLGKDLPDIQIDSVEFSYKPRGTDDDVEDGMNLIRRYRGEELAYPNYSFEEGAFDTVKMIMVSDSYGKGLYRCGLFTESFDSSQLWYYNFGIESAGGSCDIVRKENWLDVVKDNDLVVLMATEGTLRHLFWGFARNAVYNLRPNNPRFIQQSTRIRELITQITQDEKTMERLRERSKRGCPDLKRSIEREAERIYFEEQKAK